MVTQSYSYNISRRFAKILGGDLTLNEEHTNGCQIVLSLTLKKVSATKMKFNRRFGKKYKPKILQ